MSQLDYSKYQVKLQDKYSILRPNKKTGAVDYDKVWEEYTDDVDYSGPSLQEIYDSGFQGSWCDPHMKAVLKRKCGTFWQAFPESKGFGKDRLSLPYKAALIMEPNFGKVPQEFGDCTTFGATNAGTSGVSS